ncbi:MAG: thioether cross-link-forming SCIFF peptide maturase [Defluviitaleaceae bacterium]|nr:thioether cross-link-forming SCIFF peptide maturase [Defluviitaleaceae bacterium]
MIHCFKIGKRNLVLDVNSGALHSVDDAAFSVLRDGGDTFPRLKSLMRPEVSSGYHCSSEDASTISGTEKYETGDAFLRGSRDKEPSSVSPPSPSVRAEINALIDAGQLFSPDRSAETHAHMQNRAPVVKALCLHIAHECNLRCAYCFAGQGNYSDDDRGLMSFEVGKNALDFLIEKSGTRRNLEVDFFGGEPMLNFDVVKKIVAYGRERERESGKNFRFTLTTNATLLDDKNIPYINETFDNVVLSLDGRKHVNDAMRELATGGGSYEKILPKIRALVEARQARNEHRGHISGATHSLEAGNASAYYVRGTYTRHNLDFAADVLHLADAGFKNISIEPVVAPPEADYSIRECDLPTLFEEYEKLAEALLAREREGCGVFFFHFETDLTGGPCIARRVTGCGAGAEYLAVTPSGKLYPCHQFVGDEKWQSHLSLLETGDDSPSCELRQDREPPHISNFADCHVYTKPECAACWAKFYCGGGCFATAYYMNGDIAKPDKISCELMKKRVECALYIFAERKSRGT